MSFNTELMKKLSLCFSPSGKEKSVNEIIAEEAKKYVDEIHVDPVGNLILRKIGNSKKIMFMAHSDQIGLMVTSIDKDGFMRFAMVGGANPSTYLDQRVVFENGTIGVVSGENIGREKKISVEKMFIDIGCNSKEEVGKHVKIGDICVFETDYYENDDIVITRAIDDKIGCYVLLEALKKQVETDYDVYYVFSVQEEYSFCGAKTASYTVNPDLGISIDICSSGDTPNGWKIDTGIGKGVGIKIMDRSLICNPEFRNHLETLANENNIVYQPEIMEIGGTDAGMFQFARGGVKSCGLSIVTRYGHTGNEMCSKFDVNEAIRLICAVLKNNFN